MACPVKVAAPAAVAPDRGGGPVAEVTTVAVEVTTVAVAQADREAPVDKADPEAEIEAPADPAVVSDPAVARGVIPAEDSREVAEPPEDEEDVLRLSWRHSR